MGRAGFDPNFPRWLCGRLKATGLVEVGMEGHLAVRNEAVEKGP
jgi:hypothetical protein